MLGHTIAQTKTKTAASKDVVERTSRRDRSRDEIIGTINHLHTLSRRGLWGILLFLSLSAGMLCLREAGLFAMVPAELAEAFGEASPEHWLHAVLAVSWLSALVLVLGRDPGAGYSWYNIGLPTVFYPLYIFSDPAGTRFPAVFVAGLVLLLVEHVSVTLHASRALREQTERLAHLDRLGN